MVWPKASLHLLPISRYSPAIDWSNIGTHNFASARPWHCDREALQVLPPLLCAAQCPRCTDNRFTPTSPLSRLSPGPPGSSDPSESAPSAWDSSFEFSCCCADSEEPSDMVFKFIWWSPELDQADSKPECAVQRVCSLNCRDQRTFVPYNSQGSSGLVPVSPGRAGPLQSSDSSVSQDDSQPNISFLHTVAQHLCKVRSGQPNCVSCQLFRESSFICMNIGLNMILQFLQASPSLLSPVLPRNLIIMIKAVLFSDFTNDLLDCSATMPTSLTTAFLS